MPNVKGWTSISVHNGVQQELLKVAAIMGGHIETRITQSDALRILGYMYVNRMFVEGGAKEAAIAIGVKGVVKDESS